MFHLTTHSTMSKVHLSLHLFLLGISLVAKCDATPTPGTPTWMRNQLVRDQMKMGKRRLADLRREVVENGCDTNICFALDGSDAVTGKEYQTQKDFVELIVAITATDKRANLCAVQYHSKTQTISRLTGNRETFLWHLQNSRRSGGELDIVNGVRFPINQLRWRHGDAKKIVLLGKGISDIGPLPKKMAKQFRKGGGDICAVTVGPSDIAGLVDITGEPGRIVTLDAFFELSEIVVTVVHDLCGIVESTTSNDLGADEEGDGRTTVEENAEVEATSEPLDGSLENSFELEMEPSPEE